MKNKYYIFVLTFFCVFIGQKSYGQDYTISEAVDIFLENNPDYQVNELDTWEYIDILNNDTNPYNDYVDTNSDGQINDDDDLYRQTMINSLGINNDDNPVTLTDEELQTLFEACVNLQEVAVINNYHDPLFGDNGFFTVNLEDATIEHWNSMAELIDDTYDDVVDDLSFYGNIMRDWVIENQNSLLSFAHHLQNAAGYTQMTGLAIAAFTSITGVGGIFGAGMYTFGGAVNEIGVLMEVAILYIANRDEANGEFKDFLQSKIADGIFNSILPNGTSISSELSSAVDTINEAIKQAYGNATD